MLVKVKVLTNAKRDSITEEKQVLLVSVREKPAENRANVRVRELVAGHLGVPLKAVRIVRGHHAPSKLLEVFNSSGL